MKWIPLVAAAALAAGCFDDDGRRFEMPFVWQERSEPVEVPPDEVCDAFSAELRVLDTMDQQVDTFVQGEPIRVELHLTNDSADAHTLSTGSGPQVIFEVVDGDRVIAGSTLGMGWVQVPVDYPYGPGETNVHAWTWDQVRADDRQTPVGDYTLFADERTQCRTTLSRSATLSIR